MSSDIFSLPPQEITAQYIASLFLSAMTTAMVIGLIFSVVVYIFQSIGLYTIARRRKIKNPWLAWVPFGSLWMVGSISDDARLMKKSVIENRRLLVLLLVGIPTLISNVVAWGSMRVILEPFLHADQMTLEEMIWQLENISLEYSMAIAGSGFVLLLDLALTAAEITGLVFYYMSLYELYASCRPRQRVVFLVLSILFGLQPFFIFACRKHDEGMQPQQPQWPQQWYPQNPGQWPPQNPPQWPQNPGQWPPQNPPQWPQNPGQWPQNPPQWPQNPPQPPQDPPQLPQNPEQSDH